MSRLSARAVLFLLATVVLAPGLWGQTVQERLSEAAADGDVETLRLLLSQGADPQAAGASGETPLLRATRSGSLEVVRALVEAGGDPRRKEVRWLDPTTPGGSLTGLAAAEGYAEVLVYFLDEIGLPVDDRETHPKTGAATGWTPLQWAVVRGQPDIVRLLLERGAAVDRPGDTLLILLIQNSPETGAGHSHDETAEVLIEAGVPLDDADAEGLTALHWAVAGMPAYWAQWLIEAGAEVDAADANGMTPLYLAAHLGQATEAQLLACAGAIGSVMAQMIASREGHAETVDALTEIGAGGAMAAAMCQQAVEDAEVGRLNEQAEALNFEADALREAGRYAEAVEVAREALAIREAAFGPDDPGLVVSLNDLAVVLEEVGDYAAARHLYERVLAIQEAALKPNHPDLAISLSNLASLLQTLGDYEAARPLYKRALAIQERRLKPDDPALANTLNNLATLLETTGDYVAARRYYERALTTREAVLGPDHPHVAISLHNLASVLSATGEYAAARSHYERALAIQEAALGPAHPNVALSLNNLAALLDAMGDHVAALPLTERVVAIREATLGPGHPDLAVSVGNLGYLHARLDNQDAARSHYERALAIQEAALGPAHPSVAVSLNNLATLLMEMDDGTAALPLFERGIAIQETALGADHPDLALSLNNLAELLRASGAHEDARPLYERALGIRGAALGTGHPDVAVSLDNLATLLHATGDDEAARSRSLRAAHIRDAQVPLMLPTLSLAEQAAYLQDTTPRQTAALLSSHRTADALQAAYPLLARSKGLLLHGLRAQTAINALAKDSTYAQEVTTLRATRSNLVAWIADAGTRPYGEWEARYAELTTQKEQLERTLAEALPPGTVEDPMRAASFSGFAALLEPGEAFVDLYRYAHWEEGAYVEDRYAAVVTWSAGEADEVSPSHALADLGSAEALEQALAFWRDAVTGTPGAAQRRRALARLEQRFAPALAAALPSTATRLWISPDAAWARLPTAIVAEALAKHLPDRDLLVAQVPSPRALVQLRSAEPTEASGFLLAGGLDFGQDATGRMHPYAALPGTSEEVETLHSLADSAGYATTVLTGAEGDAAAVTEALPSARVVHLATHGFFAAASENGDAGQNLRTGLRAVGFGQAPGMGRSGAAAVRPNAVRTAHLTARNPLVESGLALAGANAGTRGQLTAEELVGLDLSGTELVVLSACDTGRGVEVSGQGVLGLQASLLAAGARGLLMSLWKVPDASTALLMDAFYRALWTEGLRPAEALKQAQERVREAGYTAPLHWAGWVLAGAGW